MTALYHVSASGLVPVPATKLDNESHIEQWIYDNPKIVNLDVLPIGRQVRTDFGGEIDILAIDSDGNLVIIELKRDRTPRDVTAQIIDYASWVARLTPREVHEIALTKLGRRLDEVFRERFGLPPPEALNASHRMVIVASEFDASSRRIVEYLAEHHGLDINATFFRMFEHVGEQLLATEWLMDPEQVVERSEAKVRAPWSGLWYANIGDGPSRSWEDMRKYGFLAAGGGRHYSGRLAQLEPGAIIYAYQKQQGYAGVGRVTTSACMARDAIVDGKPLLSFPLQQPNLAHDKDDSEAAEYVVLVDWGKNVPLAQAKTFTGAFANQNVVCKLRDPATIEFLQREFGLP